MHRGEDLQDLDLYSYAGIVSVKKKRAELAQEEPDHDSDFESEPNRGRRANGRYAFEDIKVLPEFEPGDIVEQQVRSLHTVPAIPGFRILSSSKEPGTRARSQLRVAKQMVALFSPWTKKNHQNHSGLLRMVTGKPDPSQTDLEVPRPTSSTSFRFSKPATTCCCQQAASTNCTSTRLTQEV